MSKSDIEFNYTTTRAFLLVTLRVLLGWYFMYEGISKITNPDWSSLGYLMDSKGPFSAGFHFMASGSNMLIFIDWLNMWGLFLIGLGLILGLFTQLSLMCGIVLLTLYYLSHPALASVNYIMPQEGSYLIVNKTLIEIFALAVLYVFPTGYIAGIDRLIFKQSKKK